MIYHIIYCFLTTTRTESSLPGQVPIGQPIGQSTQRPSLQPSSNTGNYTGVFGSRTNYVLFNGHYYSTLADVPVDGTGYLLCQNTLVALPSGWEIAPDSSDSQAVIAAHTWSTGALLVAGGNNYCGKQYGGQPGTQTHCGDYPWYQSGNQFALTGCYAEILIKSK